MIRSVRDKGCRFARSQVRVINQARRIGDSGGPKIDGADDRSSIEVEDHSQVCADAPTMVVQYGANRYGITGCDGFL